MVEDAWRIRRQLQCVALPFALHSLFTPLFAPRFLSLPFREFASRLARCARARRDPFSACRVAFRSLHSAPSASVAVGLHKRMPFALRSAFARAGRSSRSAERGPCWRVDYQEQGTVRFLDRT